MQELSDHFDIAVLAELRAVLGTDFRLLVDTFTRDGDMRVARIRAAHAAGDAEALREAVHALKGACLNIGATRLATDCLALESLARAGNLRDAGGQVQALESRFRAATAALSRHSGR